jgi:hypothetical protein
MSRLVQQLPGLARRLVVSRPVAPPGRRSFSASAEHGTEEEAIGKKTFRLKQSSEMRIPLVLKVLKRQGLYQGFRFNHVIPMRRMHLALPCRMRFLLFRFDSNFISVEQEEEP